MFGWPSSTPYSAFALRLRCRIALRRRLHGGLRCRLSGRIGGRPMQTSQKLPLSDPAARLGHAGVDVSACIGRL